jgi:methyl-accepting chemotaxis protein
VVATSIGDIAATLASAAEDAARTLTMAGAARAAAEAAKGDAGALNEAARTIEQVIALIEDVAGQTNLLALNATIEAARAGEAGRGFGVVAHEVKQLATRTSQATEDVRGGLQGITAAAARIAERVAKLVESTEQVAAVAAGISQSMREQDTNSQAITSTTARTASDVREVASTIQDVAGMIGEAKQAADVVTKVSTDLGQQAADLRAAVERFIETTERIAA